MIHCIIYNIVETILDDDVVHDVCGNDSSDYSLPSVSHEGKRSSKKIHDK